MSTTVVIPPAYDHSARLAYLQEIARIRGGKCLARAYRNTTERLEFQCERRHRWSMSPRQIFAGSWCPTCRNAGGQRQFVPHTTVPWPETKTPAAWLGAVRAVARQRGGRCLSRTCTDIDERIDLECAEGHRWDVRMRSILRGQWCKVCTRRGPAKEEQMREIAAAHGGKLLSVEYRGHGFVSFAARRAMNGR